MVSLGMQRIAPRLTMDGRPPSETPAPRASREANQPPSRPKGPAGTTKEKENAQMNPNAAIDAHFDGCRWIAFTVGAPDLWRDFYPLDMTRAQVLRAARADYIAECC